jgi:glycosyltransferase involved in cell wall biosynthesis
LLPCGLRKLADRVPLVWGPVGGATYAPWRLAGWFDPRALAGEVLRTGSTRLARRAFADPVARRAAIVVAQNPDVASRFRYARRVVLETNSALDDAETQVPKQRGTVKRAIFVGRLVAWKGPRMAVAAMADPAVADWTLDIFGADRESAALKKTIADLGLDDRVHLLGQRPRTEVLAAFAEADAMLFPSMHDSAPWAVAEASAAGCPVVCLDKGGPALLAGPNGYVVASGKNVVADLADALRRAGQSDRTPYDRWSRSRLPALVTEWYADAMATRA